MAKLDTKDLRDGATNIHSIGPDRAAGLLVAAAETIDAIRADLAEARRIAGRHSTELGHLRKLHVPGGFRSALTDKGEPAAFIPTGPIEPGSSLGFFRLAPMNAPPLLQASVNALRDRWAAETERRLRDLEVGQRLAGCLPSLDWPAEWRVLQPGENPPMGREWTIWGPMTPEGRALAESLRDANVIGGRRAGIPFKCSCPKGCADQLAMRANHGTPEQFIVAISAAGGELSIAERDIAVARYCDEWAAASEPDAATQRALNSELAAMGCDPASATQAEFKQALWRARIVAGAEIADAQLIGAPSLTVAEQFDAEASAAAEEPGTPGDGVREEEDPRTQAVLDDVAKHMAEHRRQAMLGLRLDGSVDATDRPLGDVLLPVGQPGVDLWPGSGLPPLLSTTTKAAIKSSAVDPMEDYDRAHESMMRDANLRRMLDEHKGKT